jgi:outer membrane protein TolC
VALSQSPDLSIAELETEALRRIPRQTSSLPDPVLHVGFAPRPVHTARGSQRSQWRLEQAIPFPGKRRLRREVAELTADASGFRAQAVKQDVVLRVRQAYARLFSLQQQLEALEVFKEEVTRFEAAAAAEYEVGRGPQQALLRAQLEKNSLGKRELGLQAAWHEAARDLARAMNEPDLFTDTLHVERPRELEYADTADAYELAVNQRPEFQAIEQAKASADRAVGLARREFYPDFTLQVTYTDIARESPPASPDGQDALMVGAGIRLPLWRGSLHASRQQREIERSRLDEQRRALDSDVRIRIEELRQRIKLERKNLSLLSAGLVPQAEITRDATLAAYTTGRAAFIDLLDAERMLFELQLDEITTLERLHQAIASLHRVLGSPVDIQTP